MASTDDFIAECELAAKNLRRVPKDLRRDLSSQMKEKVAVPLAGKVSGAATGPWAAVLAAGTKARAGADPTIVVGGQRPRLSGGAGPRAVIFGTEFGGGKRISKVAKTAKHRGYRRYSTNQFRAHHKPFVFPTINRNIPWVLDQFADVTMTTLEKAVNGA